MRRAPAHYDGLWRCLCPAFDQASFARAIRAPILLARANNNHNRPRLSSSRRCDVGRGLSRAYHGGVFDDRIIQKTEEDVRPEPPPVAAVPQQQQQKEPPPESALFDVAPPSEDLLKSLPVEVIRAALSRLTSFDAPAPAVKSDVQAGERIRQLVHHLLRERGDALTVFHFECMMAALANPEGSARTVHELLLDMEKEGVAPSARLCRNALLVLAVHPDYVLRQTVLGIMKTYWFTVSASDAQVVLLGYLRDEQHELAYIRLTQMLEDNEAMEIWVLDIFVMEFARLGFLDEALALLIRRKHIKGADDGMHNVLYFALDAFSQSFFHEGTVFTWNALVRNGVLTPPDGVLENVLATSARHGDTKLATEAHGIIADRSRVQTHHYESLLETFMTAGDVDGALRIVCIWEGTGFRTSRNNLRSIIDYLIHEPDAAAGAERALKRVGRQAKLPPVAVGVIVEGIAQMAGVEQAMSLYAQFADLTGEPRPLTTIQNMMAWCGAGATRNGLVAEYRDRLAGQAGLDDSRRRSQTTYARLVAACLDAGDADLAFHFADRAIPGVTTPDKAPPWLKRLMQSAFAAEDPRIWAVIDRLGGTANNEEIMNMVRILAQQNMMSKKADEWRKETAAVAARQS
ncbi:hypothetical protein N3K66_003416 [Trichothecium roseum]|uniref:Uncharacterized protein n=1 Tax=Trichothecium roseum TaxID=47278 RepID=A0ACC0V595_9HYPO|nr:hypothetical protein N3K66_003416 [Trichothecium roseum]